MVCNEKKKIILPRKVLLAQKDLNQITKEILDYKLQHLEKKKGDRQLERQQTLFLNKLYRQNLDEDLSVVIYSKTLKNFPPHRSIL